MTTEQMDADDNRDRKRPPIVDEMIRRLRGVGLTESEGEEIIHQVMISARLPFERAVDEGGIAQAEEPVEWRIQRAFLNGYREGVERAMRGRLDHS